MKLTNITEENINGFYGLLDRYWDERNESRLFMGALDEDDTPVAACAMEVLGTDLSILFFAVDPARREEGIGSDFMVEIASYAFSHGVEGISSYFYTDEPGSEIWEAFLTDTGFSVESAGLVRKTYPVSDIMDIYGESMGRLPAGHQFLTPDSLTRADKDALAPLFDTAEEEGVFVDRDELLGAENTLGGVLYRVGKPVAAVFAGMRQDELYTGTCVSFEDDEDTIRVMMNEIILRAMSRRDQPKTMVFEFGDRESDGSFFMELEDMGVEPEREQQCMAGRLLRDAADMALANEVLIPETDELSEYDDDIDLSEYDDMELSEDDEDFRIPKDELEGGNL